MSLPSFLEDLFRSTDPDILKWTNLFHERKGAGRVIKVWTHKLPGSKWEEDFVNSAVDIVVKQTTKHLENRAVRKEWQLPYSEVTAKRVTTDMTDGFGFLDRYTTRTPYLDRLLRGLLKEGGSKKNSRTQKDSSVRGTITAMLFFMSSQKVNTFQTAMGLFLHGSGCPKKVVQILAGLGLSVSYTQVQKALRSLTKDAQKQINEAATMYDWYVVYDNINITNKHHHQRIDRRDVMENGTAATLIAIASNDNNSHRTKPVIFRPEDSLPKPSAKLFLPSTDDVKMVRLVNQTHVSAAIKQLLPEDSPDAAVPIVSIDRLEVKKTLLFPLQTMKLDESTISGNLAVVERLMRYGIKLPPSWFEDPKDTIIAGDQMTVSRLLTVKVHRLIEPKVFDRFEWIHPTLQLFHLSMNLCGTIFKTHYGSPQVPGSIAAISVLLGRKRLAKDKPEFKDADELLRIIFTAKVQQIHKFLQQTTASEEFSEQCTVDIITKSFSGKPSPLLLGLPSSIANTNALLFLRDVAVHIELMEAIKVGDIGRIKHLFPILTLMMHGGGNTNYALELLRLLYGIRHLWTEEWTSKVLSSMLVNPNGVDGGWMPTDMLQENHNYLLKCIFAAKGSNMSWEYLRDAISANIRTLQALTNIFMRVVGVHSNSTKHKKASIDADVKKIQEHLQAGNVLWGTVDRQCDQRIQVVDLQRDGGEKMVSGAIGRFLDKYQKDGSVDIENVESQEGNTS